MRTCLHLPRLGSTCYHPQLWQSLPGQSSMKIYLDTCSLQRPLDTRSQLRIVLEAEAILAVLDLCDSGQVKLLTSEVLLFEIRRIQKEPRRSYALDLLSKGALHVDTNAEIERRARELTGKGINPLDALHLASAIEARRKWFHRSNW